MLYLWYISDSYTLHPSQNTMLPLPAASYHICTNKCTFVNTYRMAAWLFSCLGYKTHICWAVYVSIYGIPVHALYTQVSGKVQQSCWENACLSRVSFNMEYRNRPTVVIMVIVAIHCTILQTPGLHWDTMYPMSVSRSFTLFTEWSDSNLEEAVTLRCSFIRLLCYSWLGQIL